MGGQIRDINDINVVAHIDVMNGVRRVWGSIRHGGGSVFLAAIKNLSHTPAALRS